jgi:hypothetical protein
VEQNATKDKFSLPTSKLLFQIFWSKRGISDHMFQQLYGGRNMAHMHQDFNT